MSKAESNALVVSYDVLGTHVELDLDFVKKYLVRGRAELVSNQELVFFMNTCRQQKLNPLVQGEVYLIKYSKDDPAQMVVGKDAYLRRAFDHPDYLFKNDGITVQRGNEIIQKEGCCLYPGETLVGGWCRVTFMRNGKERTAFKEVAFAEYNKGKANWNSIYFCILTVPVGVFLALIVAVLLNAKIKGKTAFRAIFFLPMVVAPAAVAMVWKWIFNAEYGILNQVLGANIRWLTNPKIVLVTCAIVSIWSSIGYAVLLLSGIQNISQSLYEAAELDGASKVRQFFSITLPMVSPTLFVVLIMRLMASLKVYDLIYMMVDQTNPALTSAQSLMYLFYRESFIAGNKGYASAIVVWTVLLIGLVTLVQFIGQKKWVNYEV